MWFYFVDICNAGICDSALKPQLISCSINQLQLSSKLTKSSASTKRNVVIPTPILYSETHMIFVVASSENLWKEKEKHKPFIRCKPEYYSYPDYDSDL